MRAAYVEVPDGWTRLGSGGLGPFVTREVFGRPDGTQVTWESRWHRKHPRTVAGSTWWAPGALGWWIGVLFAVGSVCFALGSFPPYATGVGTDADDLTFFIGSIFFTTASFLVYYETACAPSAFERAEREGLGALLRVQHHRIDWWAAIIQFAGTLWFNRTTYSALVVGLGASSDHHPVWRPDALGLSVLPRLELVVLGRGVPWAFRLAPVTPLVVDHPVEPGRLCRLRCLGDRLLRRTQRPAGAVWP